MRSYCKNYRAIAVTTQVRTGELSMTRGRCWKWNCDHCAYVNKCLWQRHIMKGIGKQAYDQWWFVTLTASGNAHRSLKTLENLQKAWNKLYHRLRRKFPAYSPVYVWVFEPHESGQLHIHAIMSFDAVSAGFEDKSKDKKGNHKKLTRWFKDTMASLKAGYQASCKEIDTTLSMVQKSLYVVKYLTKRNQSQFIGLAHFRFVHCSQHFGALRQASEYDWTTKSGIYEDDVQKYPRVRDLNRNKDITVVDFENTYIYPPELGYD